jgi:hypothetical protein
MGGAVEPANPESAVGLRGYICEFSSWLPQGERPFLPEIPTCNLSFKRWALEEFGPFRESGHWSDTALNWKLTAGGHPPLFLPELRLAEPRDPGARRVVLLRNTFDNSGELAMPGVRDHRLPKAPAGRTDRRAER